MFREIKYGVVGLIAPFVLTLTSCAVYQPTFKGVVGNLCERTDNNPYGYCYDDLPQGGFPLVFMRDNPGSSVVGKLSIVEDNFIERNFLLNYLFYFCFVGLFLVWRFRRKLD